MYVDSLIKVLSHHRQQRHKEKPQPLTLRTIVTLINHSHSPNHEAVTTSQILSDLQELQAQGEVLAGSRNQFCMAPPKVLTKKEEYLTGVRFIGDRAYLKLAHQALNTRQPFIKTILHPEVHSFYRIKERLENQGIRCQRIDQSAEHLPAPKPPETYLLQGAQWSENPFSTTGSLEHYVPSANGPQTHRWHPIPAAELVDGSLLRLPTAEYLWYIDKQFYELTPDTAILTMFWLDQLQNLPLQVPWDEDIGRLNLQGVRLPGAYAQMLWWLSDSDTDAPRTRRFSPKTRPTAREALLRLGCQLV